MQHFLCWVAKDGICMKCYLDVDILEVFSLPKQFSTIEKMRKELPAAKQDRHIHNSYALEMSRKN